MPIEASSRCSSAPSGVHLNRLVSSADRQVQIKPNPLAHADAHLLLNPRKAIGRCRKAVVADGQIGQRVGAIGQALACTAVASIRGGYG